MINVQNINVFSALLYFDNAIKPHENDDLWTQKWQYPEQMWQHYGNCNN